MPFTPAHPAIVLPLLRSRYFSATGLVIGTMSPDFEYFFKMSVNSEYSHTLEGLIYFDLPVTLFIACLFHLVVKKNFVYNLPYFFQTRWLGVLQFDFLKQLREHWWLFVISAMIGAGSHIFWDGFTHNNAFFVRILPFYEGTAVPYEGVRYPLWYALQQISTAVGMTIVFLYILFMKPSDPGLIRRPRLLYWLVVVMVAAAVVKIRFLVAPKDFELGNFVVSCISGILIALVCCGFINFKNTPSIGRA